MVKEIQDTTADYFAMLLSTDWFLPYWSVVGINAADSRTCFQQGCRKVVREMLAGADNYYLISFAAERVAATREALYALAATCQLEAGAIHKLKNICAPRSARHDQHRTAWMLAMVLDELLLDTELDGDIKAVLQSANQQLNFDGEILQQCCLQSQTPWDTYIRQLTPELPTSLTDWISAAVLPEAKLDYIVEALDSKQQACLRARFRAIAKRVTALNDTELPDNWR